MNPKIIKFAIEAHSKVNHLYDGAPYAVHLAMVVSYAYKYKYIIDGHFVFRFDYILDACWLHDTIEDCRLTYNDIYKIASVETTEIVYALTNNKGRNRAERANDDYYKCIKNMPYATFVKICDRLANIHYSSETKSKMLDVYKKEHPEFVQKLGLENGIFQPMVNEMKYLLF